MRIGVGRRIGDASAGRIPFAPISVATLAHLRPPSRVKARFVVKLPQSQKSFQAFWAHVYVQFVIVSKHFRTPPDMRMVHLRQTPDTYTNLRAA